MREKDFQKILEIGLALSAEKDYNRLMERILADMMSLLNCDAGTLYLKNENFLEFKILRNDTMNTYQGGDGRPVDLPPVPVTRGNVCSLALLENRTICIEDVRSCKEYDLSGPIRYDAMTGYHTQSILVIPLRNREDESIGVLQLLNARDEAGKNCPFPSDKIVIAESVASQAAVAIQNMRYVEAIREMFYSFVRVISAAIDERTPYNATHTKHMAGYGERFIDFLREKSREGEPYYFTDKQKEELLISVWLHDIGKLVTPLEVMNKAARLQPEQKERIFDRIENLRLQSRIDCLEGRIGKQEEADILEQLSFARSLVEQIDHAGFLTDEMLARLEALSDVRFRDGMGEEIPLLTGQEMELLMIRKGTLSDKERAVMEKHVSITGRLLAEIRFPAEYCHVQDWAFSHHEYLDGTGYPRKLKDGQIPTEVRIITILDIFDALTAGDRPYKKGMPPERALEILMTMAEKESKLDSELTKLFAESKCWLE